tara:strand:+ start:4575 stop:5012 length:438 start_codon:yes stop_codon:yes gene_type:complete
MPTTFTNNFKNILDKLQSVLRAEFGNSLPVYVGEVNEKAGSQYLRLDPVGSELVEYSANSELREFTVDFFLYIGDKSNSRTKLDAVLRLVSRVESLIHDNIAMTLSDSSNLFNNRLESTILNIEPDSEFYMVKWEFRGQHLGNLD